MDKLCRFCETELKSLVVDLGMSPLCQTHISNKQLNEPETFYPLDVYVCSDCYLVQLKEYVCPESIFTEYAYFSSYSESWVEHAKKYAEMVKSRFALDNTSKIIEVASNDGYLLQNFVKEGIPVLGIEPAVNVAQAAIQKGIPTKHVFLGKHTANEIVKEWGKAELIIGNNVLAHVPDINDFVSGLKELLAPNGVITMEFPHLQKLIDFNQFDTIYHEHFSYLSFYTVEQIFLKHKLKLFDVEELPTHGGSLRIYARHSEISGQELTFRAIELKKKELDWGVNTLEVYLQFEDKVKETKRKILEFFIKAKNEGKVVVGYGAPGKGNTLLNYCGIREDFLDYTVDRNPYKQGKFTPGTRIPIYNPEKIIDTKPDYIFVLPWNLKDEIIEQMRYVRDWGGKFVIPIPDVEIIP